jgi:FkbM family methyltransferase
MLLLLRILNKLNVLRYLNLRFSKKINGVAFRIPVLGGSGLDLFYDKEIWMKEILRKLLPQMKEKTFIDVGVNIGQTLLTVKSIVPKVDYLGFEPNPRCIRYVEALTASNNVEPVQLVPAALGENDGVIILYKDPRQPEDSSATIVREFREIADRQQILVPVISYKSFSFWQNRTAGIIKIDVEGGELEVFKSLEKIIEQDKPFVICEILPVYKPENSFRLKRQEAILGMLRRLDYVFFRIHADGSLHQLEDIGIHGKVEDSNYLFVHRQKQQQL